MVNSERIEGCNQRINWGGKQRTGGGRHCCKAAPLLNDLNLSNTNIGDKSVASLGALKSLNTLHLRDNNITDAGWTLLASALRGGALPKLKYLIGADVASQVERRSSTR